MVTSGPAPIAAAGWFNPVHPVAAMHCGSAASHWLQRLPADERPAACAKLAEAGARWLLVPRTLLPAWPLEALDHAEIAVSETVAESPPLVHDLRGLISELTAAHVTVHGVMVQAFGMGVLLTGRSGIGKSELALELLARGHRLVADDAVEVLRLPGGVLLGRCAPLLRDFLEVRGLGILDARRMYGAKAVLDRARLDLVVHLEPQEQMRLGFLERLEGERRSRDLLGVAVPQIALPVAVGHNLATLVEAAVRDQWLRLSGARADVEFADRLQRAIDRQGRDAG